MKLDVLTTDEKIADLNGVSAISQIPPPNKEKIIQCDKDLIPPVEIQKISYNANQKDRTHKGSA